MENLLENLKNDNRGFYFTCSGYLDEIVEKDEQIIAKICYVQVIENNNQEEAIWFNCHIEKPFHKALLTKLFKMKKTATIMLQFLAKYKSLDAIHCGLTEEDPMHYILLRAELDLLQSYSITNAAGYCEKVTVNN